MISLMLFHVSDSSEILYDQLFALQGTWTDITMKPFQSLMKTETSQHQSCLTMAEGKSHLSSVNIVGFNFDSFVEKLTIMEHEN